MPHGHEEYITERCKTTGEVLNRYIKGRLLGKGGFAKCYEAIDAKTKETFAVKVVDRETLTKAKTRQKLKTEIKIHRSFKHKHVVRFLKYFEDERNVYILMELCRGNTLMDLTNRKRHMSEEEAAYFTYQLLKGTAYMHNEGVIHRDLKLGNLMLTDQYEVKIGDFGLAARIYFEGEKRRTLCGTPNYIAPEILQSGHCHSYEVDIWAIGVILYALLVGSPPFQTSDVKATYGKIKKCAYSYPPHIRISKEAKALIGRILQITPEGRPTVHELLEDPWFKIIRPRKYAPLTLFQKGTLAYDRQRELLLSSGDPANSHHEIAPPREGERDHHHHDPRERERAYDRDPAAHRERSASKPRREALRTLDANRAALPPSKSAAAAGSDRGLENRQLPTAHTRYRTGSAPRPQNPASHPVASPGRGAQVHVRSSSSHSIRSRAAVPVNGRRTGSLDARKRAEQAAADDAAAAAGTSPPARAASQRHLHGGSPRQQQQQQQQPMTRSNSLKSRTHSRSPSLPVNYATHPVKATAGPAPAPASTTTRSPTPAADDHPSVRRHAWAAEPAPAAGAAPVPAPAAREGSNNNNNNNNNNNVDDEVANLTHMRERLEVTLGPQQIKEGVAGVGPAAGAAEEATAEQEAAQPQLWVQECADFSAKYGLAYRLSNGQIGVHFNDNSKMIYTPATREVYYVEKGKRAGAGGNGAHPHDPAAEVITHHTIDAYPDSLSKKVTLVKYFASYIEKFKGKTVRPEQQPVVTCSKAANTGVHNHTLAPNPPTAAESKLVYVRKWLQTSEAIIFRLSNKRVQVCFTDGSEIILTSEARLVTYTDTRGQRRTTSLMYIANTQPDIASRLWYTKDIIGQLLNLNARKE